MGDLARTRNSSPMATALPTSVQNVAVTADEAGMRVDRFFEARFPGLSYSHIQRVIRKGEVRVNGKRTEPEESPGGGADGAYPAVAYRCPKAAFAG